MISAIIQSLPVVISWTIRIIFVAASVFAFIGIFTIGVSAILTTINQSVFNDLIALFQMWLPFNFVTILIWLFATVTIYFIWKISVLVLRYISDLLGNV